MSSKADDISILVLNPNSSESVTDGLASALTLQTPADVVLHFRTGPSDAPPSINDPPTSVQSAWANFVTLVGPDGSLAEAKLGAFDAILVCCFSDHPLVAMLRHVLPPAKPVMHILEASVMAALSAARGRPIGIITTGADMVRDIDAGVHALLGATATTRYAGCLATGLGVVEMRTNEAKGQERVRTTIRQTSANLAQRDVGAVIIGCAGMAGFEAEIRYGMVQILGQAAGAGIAIVDGAKAGVQLLAGQVRAGYFEP